MGKVKKEITRAYKEIYKDLAPVKDVVTQITEEEPKTIEEMKRRLSKK